MLVLKTLVVMVTHQQLPWWVISSPSLICDKLVSQWFLFTLYAFTTTQWFAWRFGLIIVYCRLMYTHCWDLMESVMAAYHCYLSWSWWSDTSWAIFIMLWLHSFSCYLQSFVVEVSLQVHSNVFTICAQQLLFSGQYILKSYQFLQSMYVSSPLKAILTLLVFILLLDLLLWDTSHNH
jgi:hypothetical protein